MPETLTREAVLAMPAGRELDRLIHVHVMGKRAEFIASEPNVTTDDPTAPLGFTCNFGGNVFTADGEWLVDDWLDPEVNLAVPSYSTDIAAAWKVVESVDCFYFHLDRLPHNWYACFGTGQSHEATAETPMLAICRAALLTTI